MLTAEHPFPAAVEAAADVIEWLAKESGETAPYIAGECGDSEAMVTWLRLVCGVFCGCQWLSKG
jgi:hypothetical protein